MLIRAALLLAHIFQTHPIDLSLHVALKHTVISCPFFDSALKGSGLLSTCTASWKKFSFRMSQIKHGFWFTTCLAKLSTQTLLLQWGNMFQNWWQVSQRNFVHLCICKCTYRSVARLSRANWKITDLLESFKNFSVHSHQICLRRSTIVTHVLKMVFD